MKRDLNEKEMKQLISSKINSISYQDLQFYPKKDAASLIYESYKKEVKNLYQRVSIIGKLDTFKNAACLIISFLKTPIFERKGDFPIFSELEFTRTLLGIEAAFEWIENPFIYTGMLAIRPVLLPAVQLHESFSEEFLLEREKGIIESLRYQDEKGWEQNPLDLAQNLYVLYSSAACIQNKGDKINMTYQKNMLKTS